MDLVRELDPNASEAVSGLIKNASRALKGGDWIAASQQFDAIIAKYPNEPRSRVLYGTALAKRADDAAAEIHFRHAVSVASDSLDAWLALAKFFAGHRRDSEAFDAFQRAREIDPRSIDALLGLAKVQSRQRKRLEAYQLFEQALAIAPNDARTYRLYANALSKHGAKLARYSSELQPNSAHAASVLSTVMTRANMLQEAKKAAQRAVDIDPSLPGAENRLAAVEEAIKSGGKQRRPGVWPTRAKMFQDFEAVVRRYVLPGARPAAPVLRSTSKVVTIGSCFAEHVANKLRERNVDVFYRKIGEDINNSYANLALLEWIAGKGSGEAVKLSAIYGTEARVLYERQFRGADVVILSLGVAAANFERSTGRFVLPDLGTSEGGYVGDSKEFRMLSVDENVHNFRAVIAQIREFSPSANIVLTVSPVPLAGTFERPSAVLADAVSKSVQRLTVERLLADEKLYYWPSFEIVRWLGAHLPPGAPRAFGEEDGSTRHVSSWLVSLIMNLFVEYFGEGIEAGPSDRVAQLTKSGALRSSDAD